MTLDMFNIILSFRIKTMCAVGVKKRMSFYITDVEWNSSDPNLRNSYPCFME